MAATEVLCPVDRYADDHGDLRRRDLVEQNPKAFSLDRALSILRHRLPLVVLCVVIVAGAAFGFSERKTKKYTASVTLNFESNPLNQQILGLSTNGLSNSSNALLAQEAGNVEVVKNEDVVTKTAHALGLTDTAVINSLSVSGQGEAQIVTVSATTTSPARSAAIANTYGHQFLLEQQKTTLKQYKAALAIVRKQLAALSPAQQVGADGLALQNRAQTLSLQSELNPNNVSIGSEALPPASPSSPRTSRDTALGGFIGLLIGIALVLLLERADRRIRAPEDLEAIYRLPLLGSVPRSGKLARHTRQKGGRRVAPPPAEIEEFNLIRARLRFFNIDRDLRTVMVASTETGDGKTLVARLLAEAAARSGARVLLIDADLRNPTIVAQFAISPGPGLANVLVGVTPASEAIQSVALDGATVADGTWHAATSPAQADKAPTLDVLATGVPLPPNPSELLESRATHDLLVRVRQEYDLVVIDTPALTAVSDAFALLRKVDGIVVVGRIGVSRCHAAERLHQVLRSSGASLLGVIANCSKWSGPTIYAYSSPNDEASHEAPLVDDTSSPGEMVSIVRA
jgi:polysaccharide biosynthesis transport protein